MSMKQEWQALVLSKESDFPFGFLYSQDYYEHLVKKFFLNN